MLNIHNLSVSFGGTYLFEEVTFRLGAGDRVGLVGKNGAGKSTMLKMLARDFAPDSGVISQEKDLRMGFLRQDIDFEQGRTVLEEAYEAFTEIKDIPQGVFKFGGSTTWATTRQLQSSIDAGIKGVFPKYEIV